MASLLPASTAAWDDAALHTTHEIVLPRGITLKVSSVRRAELVVAVNQRRVREREDITGLRLWDFGRSLAAFAVRRFARALRGKRVLEMGAGCGVLSLAVACACDGVASVTATDASSLGFLRRNVDAHRDLFVQGAEVKVERLLWRTKEAWQEEVVMGSKRKDGDVEVDEGERQELERILVRETDEQDETAGGLPVECAACGDVDIVIGTDLLYHLTAADALFATAKRMLRADGVFVLGGHSRYYGTVQSIRDSARAHGLFVRFVDMRVLRKAEGFEYCAGDFLAVMAERESDIERFALDVNQGVDEEIGEVSTGLDLGEKVSAPAPAAFRFDDSVNDDFEEDGDDDY